MPKHTPGTGEEGLKEEMRPSWMYLGFFPGVSLVVLVNS